MEYGIAFHSDIDAWREVQQFVTEDNLARSLTGSGTEIIEKLINWKPPESIMARSRSPMPRELVI